MGFQQGFRINTNTAALDTYRSYSSAQADLEQNIERLSSGKRINRASDDAAGLAISERMNNQVRGCNRPTVTFSRPTTCCRRLKVPWKRLVTSWVG